MNLWKLCFLSGLLSASALMAQTAPVGAPEPLHAMEFRLQVEEPFVFAAFGDLRVTDLANHTSSDPERRQAIIHAIAEINPSFIAISGDLVLNGANVDDWREWDKETAEWKSKKLQVFPAPGNHDTHEIRRASCRERV